MGLSPSAIFHFTKKKALMGILKDNFKLKYCLEIFDNIFDEIKIAVPMISFCDIKVSDITDHTEKYGRYGIGLKKEWAIDKGVNPVYYLNNDTPFGWNLSMELGNYKLKKDQHFTLSGGNGIIRYLKKYEGELKRKGKPTIENYRFADEREWRYVPSHDSAFPPFLFPNQYKTANQKRSANLRVSKERLEFTPDDILYIIVEKEEEIDEILEFIRDVKGRKNYSNTQIDKLATRILTFERIKFDF